MTSLSRLRPIANRPGGQVLAATLLFIFVFTVLFAALYKAGIAYQLKARAVRGGDLTALSCGAVYANGLQWVRHSNVALMAAAAYDLSVIASVYVTTSVTGPAAVAAALAADPKSRKTVQKLQDAVLGVDGGDVPDDVPGIYPLLVCSEGYALASDNRLESRFPIQPVFLFNPESSGALRALIPHLALRFRTADELLPGMDPVDEKEPCYRLRDRSDGRWRYFRFDQVEPAPMAAPGQMRVKCGLPSPYRCKYVENLGNDDLSTVKWALKRLQDVLKHIRLDVTHRDRPPQHAVLVYSRLVAPMPDGRPIHQISESSVVARPGEEGLAAWDVLKPRFKARLKALEPERLPVIRGIVEHIPPWLKDMLKKSVGWMGKGVDG